MKKFKTLEVIEFLPNEMVKKINCQIPKEAKNPLLIIGCTRLNAPTNEKIFFCSCTQNSKSILSKAPIANQNIGVVPIGDFLKNYFTLPSANLQNFKRFFNQIKIPLQEGETNIKGTIYTKEPTGKSRLDIILSYEL